VLIYSTTAEFGIILFTGCMNKERVDGLLAGEGGGLERMVAEFIYLNIVHDEASRRRIKSPTVRVDFIVSEIYAMVYNVHDGVIQDMLEKACNGVEKNEGLFNKVAVTKLINQQTKAILNHSGYQLIAGAVGTGN
jgi:hypothetical protein